MSAILNLLSNSCQKAYLRLTDKKQGCGGGSPHKKQSRKLAPAKVQYSPVSVNMVIYRPVEAISTMCFALSQYCFIRSINHHIDLTEIQ
jgi:hypothetical protein